MPHPFETKGLAIAPFKLIDSERHDPRVRCDFCGQSINYKFTCEGADGRRFGVGSDCVMKVDPLLSAEIESARKELERKADDELISIAKMILDHNPELLSDRPHPLGRKGETARDYVNFCFQNAGLSKQLTVSRMVKRAAEAASERKT